MRYEYKLVRIELKRGFWVSKPKQDYHEIIDRHASEGWRFVQLFAPACYAFGRTTYFELIFERPIE